MLCSGWRLPNQAAGLWVGAPWARKSAGSWATLDETNEDSESSINLKEGRGKKCGCMCVFFFFSSSLLVLIGAF